MEAVGVLSAKLLSVGRSSDVTGEQDAGASAPPAALVDIRRQVDNLRNVINECNRKMYEFHDNRKREAAGNSFVGLAKSVGDLSSAAAGLNARVDELSRKMDDKQGGPSTVAAAAASVDLNELQRVRRELEESSKNAQSLREDLKQLISNAPSMIKTSLGSAELNDPQRSDKDKKISETSMESQKLQDFLSFLRSEVDNLKRGVDVMSSIKDRVQQIGASLEETKTKQDVIAKNSDSCQQELHRFNGVITDLDRRVSVLPPSSFSSPFSSTVQPVAAAGYDFQREMTVVRQYLTVLDSTVNEHSNAIHHLNATMHKGDAEILGRLGHLSDTIGNFKMPYMVQSAKDRQRSPSRRSYEKARRSYVPEMRRGDHEDGLSSESGGDDNDWAADCFANGDVLPDGPQRIRPTSRSLRRRRPIEVLCSDGLTVIQSRFDGSENFHRNWSDYKHGFGRAQGDHWLGMDNIRQLLTAGVSTTNDDDEDPELLSPYALEVELWGDGGSRKYLATYNNVWIGPECKGYPITVGGFSSPDVADAMAYHKRMRFSTVDRDNDEGPRNCAEQHMGGWWYKDCQEANLNGAPFPGSLFWNNGTSSGPIRITRSRMSLRRKETTTSLDINSLLDQGYQYDISRKALLLPNGGMPTIQLNNINVFPKSDRVVSRRGGNGERKRMEEENLVVSSRSSQQSMEKSPPSYVAPSNS